jgi:DNA-binding transcriptional LysR family regulator
VNWDDLRLFVLVARHGGLTAAARAAGLSPPTVGRRLQALEAALGRVLFEHRATGYALTAAGRELLAEAEPVEAAMLGVQRWRDRGAQGRTVRVSAGTWTNRFLAQNVGALIGPGDAFRLQFLPADERLDIGRRAADIGLRNRRPEEAWLAGRRLGTTAFAIYARPDAAERPYVAPLSALTPSAAWLRARHGAEIGIEASNPRSVLDLARAGAGRALLPCFVGDAEPGLVRLEGPIVELDQEQWLVMHHEERHEPAVRQVARRIVRLLRAARVRFQGSAPQEAAPAGG